MPSLTDETMRLRLRALRSGVAGPFDLELQAGACIAITGPSGAGKSVLLRMIADLDPNEGTVTFDGQDRSSMTGPQWRRRVVYAAAEPGWWDPDVGPHFPTHPVASAARLGLPSDIFDRPVRLCSTGERQRLALLRALCITPGVLLLDEPTASLDAASIQTVEAMLHEALAGGMAILLVTHDPAQAERMGTGGQRHVRDGRFVPS